MWNLWNLCTPYVVVFENGFRHISNRLRPIHTPADMKGMTIRVLPSKVQERTFALLGATPRVMDLSELLPAIKAGMLDVQENPFSNTTTYGVHKFHRFHTASNHFYLSRPIFFSRTAFDEWPKELQVEMRAAVQDAVTFQRTLHVKEEEDAMVEIRKEGGEIVELTPEQHQKFVDAVKPIYGEARGQDRPRAAVARETLGCHCRSRIPAHTFDPSVARSSRCFARCSQTIGNVQRWPAPGSCVMSSRICATRHYVRLSIHRDQRVPPSGPRGTSERDLTLFINDLNATWIRVSERFSSRVLTDLYSHASEELVAFIKRSIRWQTPCFQCRGRVNPPRRNGSMSVASSPRFGTTEPKFAKLWTPGHFGTHRGSETCCKSQCTHCLTPIALSSRPARTRRSSSRSQGGHPAHGHCAASGTHGISTQVTRRRRPRRSR